MPSNESLKNIIYGNQHNKEIVFQTFYLHSSHFEAFLSQMKEGTIFSIDIRLRLFDSVSIKNNYHSLHYCPFIAKLRLNTEEQLCCYWLTNDARRATLELLKKFTVKAILL